MSNHQLPRPVGCALSTGKNAGGKMKHGLNCSKEKDFAPAPPLAEGLVRAGRTCVSVHTRMSDVVLARSLLCASAVTNHGRG